MKWIIKTLVVLVFDLLTRLSVLLHKLEILILYLTYLQEFKTTLSPLVVSRSTSPPPVNLSSVRSLPSQNLNMHNMTFYQLLKEYYHLLYIIGFMETAQQINTLIYNFPPTWDNGSISHLDGPVFIVDPNIIQ
ncbi:unnamed protein product [Rhizophagus irregularis]|nr:unnamed protein product [Rhizophagus irregularis]